MLITFLIKGHSKEMMERLKRWNGSAILIKGFISLKEVSELMAKTKEANEGDLEVDNLCLRFGLGG